MGFELAKRHGTFSRYMFSVGISMQQEKNATFLGVSALLDFLLFATILRSTLEQRGVFCPALPITRFVFCAAVWARIF